MEHVLNPVMQTYRRFHIRILAAAAMPLALLFAGCGAAAPTGTISRTASPSTATGSPTTTSGGTSSSLPLGDGKTALTPRVGYVMSCSTTFPGQGGADRDGPWIDAAAGTWNSAQKIHVQGSVAWPEAHFAVTTQDGTRTITTNDLPNGEPTGTFPIASSDPAYAYDRNPNHIAAQALTYTLPAAPTAAARPSCLHGGPIGVTLDGVVLFDALDAGGRDAVAHEVQDACGGHPDMSSMYHYHDISPCLLKTTTSTSTLVGYALDGFGIYVERDASGALVTDTALDACHGRVSTVEWDGKSVSMYHYDATAEYPYTLGCFMGSPAVTGGPPA